MGSILTDMSIVAELGKIRIEGDAMVGQHVQFVGDRVKFRFHILEFIVDVRVFVAEVASSLLVIGMDFSYGSQLDYGSDKYQVPMKL